MGRRCVLRVLEDDRFPRRAVAVGKVGSIRPQGTSTPDIRISRHRLQRMSE